MNRAKENDTSRLRSWQLPLWHRLPALSVKGENLIFKRWDKLEAEDMPEVVIFLYLPTSSPVCSHWLV